MKIFGIGLLGGILPLAIFMMSSSNPTSPQSDTVFGESGNGYAHNASFNGLAEWIAC